MPVRKTKSGFAWGHGHGTFKTKVEAEAQGRAAYANGYRGDMPSPPENMGNPKVSDMPKVGGLPAYQMTPVPKVKKDIGEAVPDKAPIKVAKAAKKDQKTVNLAPPLPSDPMTPMPPPGTDKAISAPPSPPPAHPVPKKWPAKWPDLGGMGNTGGIPEK